MIADLFVYELGDVMLLTMPGDVKDDGAGEARSVHLHARTCSSATSPTTFAQIAVVGPDAARGRRRACVGVRRRATLARAARARQSCARRSAGGAAIVDARRPTPASPVSTCYVERAQAAALQRGARGGRRVELDAATAEALRIEAGRAAVPSRHGRGDDSARGRHRVARDQLHARAATSGRK